MKLSEWVRRLEDSIESLRLENKMLKEDTADIRDEVIEHQKWEISKLKTELSARVKQVEDLQSSYKTLQKENERLNSKLEQTVDEYDEDYQTFHNNRKYTENRGEKELHPYGRSIADYIEADDLREIFKKFLWHDPF